MSPRCDAWPNGSCTFRNFESLAFRTPPMFLEKGLRSHVAWRDPSLSEKKILGKEATEWHAADTEDEHSPRLVQCFQDSEQDSGCHYQILQTLVLFTIDQLLKEYKAMVKGLHQAFLILTYLSVGYEPIRGRALSMPYPQPRQLRREMHQ